MIDRTKDRKKYLRTLMTEVVWRFRKTNHVHNKVNKVTDVVRKTTDFFCPCVPFKWQQADKDVAEDRKLTRRNARINRMKYAWLKICKDG